MTTLTASNERVQHFIYTSPVKPSTRLKKARLGLFEDIIKRAGKFISEIFPNKQQQVLDEIIYLTSGCGIAKIGSDVLADLSGVSVRTVNTVVKKLKEDGQFLVARINKSRAGKYIFVDKLHANFKEIMDYVFSENAEQFAYQFAEQLLNESIEAVSVKDEKTVSNYNNSFNSFKTSSLNNKYIYNNKFENREAIKDEPKQSELEPSPYLNNYQIQLYKLIMMMPFPTVLKENANTLCLSVNIQNAKQFVQAKDSLKNLAMDLHDGLEIKKSLRAVFSGAYEKSIIRPTLKKIEESIDNTVPPFTFLNWLDKK